MKTHLHRTVEKALGQVVATRRKRLELSQEELGFRSGFHRTFISQLERGLKSPSLRSLVAISKALETEPDVLVREAVRVWRDSTR